jgi:hypothetical protein
MRPARLGNSQGFQIEDVVRVADHPSFQDGNRPAQGGGAERRARTG